MAHVDTNSLLAELRSLQSLLAEPAIAALPPGAALTPGYRARDRAKAPDVLGELVTAWAATFQLKPGRFPAAPIRDMARHFRNYCLEQGVSLPDLTPRRFGPFLRERGFTKFISRKGSRGYAENHVATTYHSAGRIKAWLTENPE